LHFIFPCGNYEFFGKFGGLLIEVQVEQEREKPTLQFIDGCGGGNVDYF